MLHKMILALEKAGFSVCPYRIGKEDMDIQIGKYSPAGQDFSFNVTCQSDASDFADKIYEAYNSFDISAETYVWLDSEGHGKNGAPHDMRDLYADMEACEQYIKDAYDIVEGISNGPTDYITETLGDNAIITFPSGIIDCSELQFFDNLEYDCWELIKKYAEAFEITITYPDNDDDEEGAISFDIAKEVQDFILGIFERCGVKFSVTYFDRFKEKAFEKYKEDWISTHDYDPEHEHSCYACYEEFLDYEFQDEDYMRELMGDEYDEYLNACKLFEVE